MAALLSTDFVQTLALDVQSAARGQQTWQTVELGKKLLISAQRGDSVNVMELMIKGAPFTTDWLGTSALHLAASNNHIETCNILLRAGISRDTRTKVERTPLHMAAYVGHHQVCELLLKNGAYVDCRDMLQMTPLHWATEKGHTECVKILLKHGADPKSICKFYRTPVIIAKNNQRDDLVELLEEAIIHKDSEILRIQQQSISEEETLSPKHQSDELRNEETNKLLESILPQQDLNTDSNKAAIELLKSHGISMQPVEHNNTVLSAVNSGRTVVLSDAGKLMLKESTPIGTGDKNVHKVKPIQTNNKYRLVKLTGEEIDLEKKPHIIKKVVKLNAPNQIKYIQLPKGVHQKVSPMPQVKKPKNSPILNLSQLQALQKEGLIQIKNATGLKSGVRIVMHKSNLSKLVDVAKSNMQGLSEDKLQNIPISNIVELAKVKTEEISELDRLKNALEKAKSIIIEKDKIISSLQMKLQLYEMQTID